MNHNHSSSGELTLVYAIGDFFGTTLFMARHWPMQTRRQALKLHNENARLLEKLVYFRLILILSLLMIAPKTVILSEEL